MKIIGVTGGIGAGKSSVSVILKELGAEVIDADQISKQVTEPNTPAWKRIVESFGREVLLPDNTLNRKELAKIIFRSEKKRLLLEDIIHLQVTRVMRDRIKALKAAGYDGIVVLDVPIPVQSGFLDIVDSVWVVTCKEEERIRRIMLRSGASYEDIRLRVKAQLSQKEYIKLSDDVIANDGNLETLKRNVDRLWQSNK